VAALVGGAGLQHGRGSPAGPAVLVDEPACAALTPASAVACAAVAGRELRVRQQGVKSGLTAEAAEQLNDLLSAP
jgi:hypothetical protein